MSARLVEMGVVEDVVRVRVARRDLDVHVAMGVEAVHDRHRLAVLRVDLARHVLHLHLAPAVRRDVQLRRLAAHNLSSVCVCTAVAAVVVVVAGINSACMRACVRVYILLNFCDPSDWTDGRTCMHACICEHKKRIFLHRSSISYIIGALCTVFVHVGYRVDSFMLFFLTGQLRRAYLCGGF